MIRRHFFRSLIGLPVAGVAVANTEPPKPASILDLPPERSQSIAREIDKALSQVMPKIERVIQSQGTHLGVSVRRCDRGDSFTCIVVEDGRVREIIEECELSVDDMIQSVRLLISEFRASTIRIFDVSIGGVLTDTLCHMQDSGSPAGLPLRHCEIIPLNLFAMADDFPRITKAWRFAYDAVKNQQGYCAQTIAAHLNRFWVGHNAKKGVYVNYQYAGGSARAEAAMAALCPDELLSPFQPGLSEIWRNAQ